MTPWVALVSFSGVAAHPPPGAPRTPPPGWSRTPPSGCTATPPSGGGATPPSAAGCRGKKVHFHWEFPYKTPLGRVFVTVFSAAFFTFFPRLFLSFLGQVFAPFWPRWRAAFRHGHGPWPVVQGGSPLTNARGDAPSLPGPGLGGNSVFEKNKKYKNEKIN